MKKIIIIFLLILSMFFVSSCKEQKIEKVYQDDYIVDANLNKVYLLDDPTKATVASVYAVSTPFLIALDITDRVLAINTKKVFLKEQDVYLKNAGTVGNGTVDLEKLALYNPTVLIHRSNDIKTVTKVKELGIDVIEIKVESMEDVKNTITILGKYFGVSNRAVVVNEYIDKEFAFIDSVVSTIPDKRKVSALVMGGEIGRVAGNDMLQTWMIEKAGGIATTDTGIDHNWINIGEEKLCEWNPEYIFMTSSAARSYTKAELLSSGSLSEIEAIKNSNVYQIPSEADSWDMPGISPIIGTLYMLRMMYPEYISLDTLNEHIDNYYTFMFGRTFSSDELKYSIE